MAEKADITVERMNDEARVRLIDGLENKGAHLSFEDAVRNFPENLMNEKPPHVPYTFWHQLEHIRRTQEDMLNYIQDQNYVAPAWPKDYWPDQSAKTDRKGWDTTIREYLSGRKQFVDLVSDPKMNLLAPVKRLNNRSVLRCALIINNHTAYHLGELVMGRQILGAWKSELG